MTSTRRLSVILAADAVGYSRLAEADERAALEAVSWFRDKAGEIASAYGGRVFSRAGDGIMAELPSAEAGVRAALELAQTVRARVEGGARPALPIRVGLHCGDVSEQADGDRLGHDVNVAARIEQLGEAGEVLASRALVEAARGKAPARFERIGAERAKNLKEPIELFRVVPGPSGLSRGPLMVAAAGFAAAVVLVAGGVWLGVRGEPRSADVATAPSAEDRVSLAVLPFANLSSDPEQEYFSDGLSEELLNQLAQVDGLRVIARTSSFAFKGRNLDMREIGQTLGVARLLEGSVRKSGDELRITAQLIDASDGSHIWSQTYDRKLDDVFAIQEEIAFAVSSALTVELGVDERLRTIGDTENVAAYEAVLRARAWVSQEGPQALANAVELYRQAVASDPEFALAWAELARELARYQYLVPDQADPLGEELERAVDRALALEPDLWLAHAVKGDVFARQRDWGAAMESYERFRALAPQEGDTNTQFLIPYQLGDADAAVAWARASIALDPLSLPAARDAMSVFMRAGLRAEAAQQYARSLDLVGDRVPVEHYRLYQIWDDGEPARVQAQMRLVARLGSSLSSTIADVADVFDDPDAALEVLRAAAADPANQDSLRLPTLATWLSHYGDPELAVELLHRTYIDLGSTTYLLLWNPPLANARRLPEFKALVDELGMVDYWRDSGNWGDFCRPVGENDFECF